MSPLATGGDGGAINGAETLVPLRGGCPSGGEDIDGTVYNSGTPGGGAVQMSSRQSIRIDGIVDVRGQRALIELANLGYLIPGGGAGGGILLEAPMVTLNGRLIAKGGAGGGYGANQPSSDDTDSPDLGPSCGSSPHCGDGGNGAAPGIAATAGESVPYTNSTAAPRIYAGGGGGGLGRIRINTADGTYIKSSASVEAGVVTTGTLLTR